uniref:Uncharacterized protein n=1 Tax=Minutocellus polymorphus TaxID=265543 RepID=A0A7S0AP51_9STRA|mmetsp:Transcript_18172/g.30176  ORF Transcript_18172/g.30176 Transcript_18172/m.30176 type:complete len:122 (+) Transcript_18172:22-387(+)
MYVPNSLLCEEPLPFSRVIMCFISFLLCRATSNRADLGIHLCLLCTSSITTTPSFTVYLAFLVITLVIITFLVRMRSILLAFTVPMPTPRFLTCMYSSMHIMSSRNNDTSIGIVPSLSSLI